MLSRLGYIGIAVPDVAAWKSFGPDVLGAALAHDLDDGGLSLALGNRDGVIRVHPGTASSSVSYLGWELEGTEALAVAAGRLDTLGLRYERATPERAKDRAVDDLVSFVDPFGYTHELYTGPHLRAKPATEPAGSPALGHAFLLVPDADKAEAFFLDVLDLDLSDRIDFTMGATPFHRGPTPVRSSFLSAGDRHHVLAIASMPAGFPEHGLGHLMLEVGTLDEVGRVYDICHELGSAVTTLGRHTNDQMVSFYLSAPGGISIEFGCDGCPPRRGPHVTPRYDAPSSWGHHPLTNSVSQ